MLDWQYAKCNIHRQSSHVCMCVCVCVLIMYLVTMIEHLFGTPVEQGTLATQYCHYSLYMYSVCYNRQYLFAHLSA